MTTKKAKAKSTEIEYVLELTEDEALGILALVGGTTGEIGWDVYDALGSLTTDGAFDPISRRPEARFPNLKGTGRFA